MQFKCYAYPDNEVIDASAFVAFRADNKFVMGVLPNGHERLLLNPVNESAGADRRASQRVTLKAIETELRGVLRASRDVLVVGTAALALVGKGYQRQVITTAGVYSLSRRQDVRPFELACANNAQRIAAERLAARSARRSAGAHVSSHCAA